MLRPARMSKLKAIVLDQYSEDVIREFSKLGTVHILDVKSTPADWKGLMPVTENPSSVRCAEYLGRVYYLMDILGIKEEKDFFGSLKRDPKRISWKDESSSRQLAKVEETLLSMEKEVRGKSERLVKMGEEKARLEPEKKVLESLSKLNVKSNWLGDSRFLYLASGMITPEDLDKLETLLEKETFEYVIKEASNGERIAMLLLTPKQYKQDVDKILSGLDFQRFALDANTSIESLKDIKKRLDEIEKESKHLEKDLVADKAKYIDKLLGLKEVLQIEKDISDTNNYMAKTQRVYVLEGWVPDKKVASLTERIKEITNGCSVVKIVKPKKGEVVPTKLDNPKIFKPFETLIETFGLPSYKELDPTMILAFTFPLFYGLMFGDIGHGLMLVLLGLVVMKIAKTSQGTKNLGVIIMTCGLFAVVFGFVYGEAFGMGPEAQLDFTKKVFGEQGEFKIPSIYPQVEGDKHPGFPKVNPMELPKEFLLIAIFLGSFHIVSGLVMNFLNKIVQKDYMGGIAGPVPKLWLFLGAFYLLNTYWIDFGAWGANIGLVILLIPVPMVLILLEGIIHHLPHFDAKQLGANLGQGAFEVFDIVLMFLSNSVSYSRIFALALVHGGLFLALFSIADKLIEIPAVGWIAWFIVVLIGTIAVLALESIIVFLHSLRLHYYEWFTKFYGADGVKYTPFKAERVYTKVEE